MLMKAILVMQNLETVFTSQFRMLDPPIMRLHVFCHFCLSGSGKLAENVYKVSVLVEGFLMIGKICLGAQHLETLLTLETFPYGMMSDIIGLTFAVFPEYFLTYWTGFGSNLQCR